VYPLYQRLKELDPDSFEKLCCHLVQARLPGTEIRHVDGAAGDEGLDLFMGFLDAGPTIWQCKSFPNGVGKHQREQIRAWLRRALTHAPRRWVLCLSVEMFFPHAVFDVAGFLETVAKTGRLSTDELAAVNAGNVEQYLKRLEEADARFAYSVTYQRNLQPQTNRLQPALIASISDETKTINVFARDLEALKWNPPKWQFTVTGSGVDKMEELIRSGRPQVIGPEELLDFTSDFAFISPPKGQTEGATLFIGPAAPAAPPRLWRVTFGCGEDAVVYECIRFVIARRGSEEAEVESSGALPFRISLIVKPSGTGSVHFERRWAGADIRAVQKFMRALKALVSSRKLEIYDVGQAVTLLKPRIGGTLPAWFSAYEALIDDAVLVADFYGVKLQMPEGPTPVDRESLALLKGLIDGIPVDVEDMTLTLTKCADVGAAQAETVRGEGSYLVTVPEYAVRPVLFGVRVCTGPVAYQIPPRPSG